MKIKLPANFPIPENARPGEPFEVVATLAPGEDGAFTLTAIDGMELPEEGEDMEEEEGGGEMTPVNERNSAAGIELPF